MRMSPFVRVLTACFGVWFAFVVAEPLLSMHDCPVHDGFSSAAAAAHHGGHHSSTHGKQNAGHNCSCLGDCNTCCAFALAPTQFDAMVSGTIKSVTERVGFSTGYIATWTQHVLPFQNGPPLA